MGVVERILHQPQCCGVPLIIELVDHPVTRAVIFRDFRDVIQRLVERDPDVAIAGLGSKRTRLCVRNRLLKWKLRNHHQLAVAVIFPSVITANDVTVVAPTLGELRGTVTAAVFERGRFALAVKEQHDRFPEKRERPRAVLEVIDGHDRVPKSTKYGLFGIEHEFSAFQAARRATTRIASDLSF